MSAPGFEIATSVKSIAERLMGRKFSRQLNKKCFPLVLDLHTHTRFSGNYIENSDLDYFVY